MPKTAGLLRLFVSSTFSEFGSERNVLAREVFPKLKSFCLARGQRFQAIDLRWGITTESELGWRPIDVCLREIDRCVRTGSNPSFLLLQGQRRGARPLPERISKELFDAIRSRVGLGEDLKLLERRYRLDENAVPPHYELLPPANGAALRDLTAEEQLRQLLEQCAQSLAMSAAERAAFTFSATEQELDYYLRLVQGDGTGLLCMRRSAAEEVSSQTLASPWSSVPAECVTRYAWDEAAPADRMKAQLSEFARLTRERLEQSVQRHLDSLQEKPLWSVQHDGYLALTAQRAEQFVGRSSELARIAAYQRDPAGMPLLVHGAGGIGKTALMGRAWFELREQAGSIVMARFVGADSGGNHLRELISSLRAELADRLGIEEQDLIGHDSSFQVQLNTLLDRATVERPVTIIIDAVDQLPEHEADTAFNWISSRLPAHSRLIVSCLTARCAPLRARLPDLHVLEFGPLPPTAASELLTQFLSRSHRQLTPTQSSRILAAPDSGSPLYLRTVSAAASAWRSWTEDGTVPSTTAEVLRDMLSGARADHGKAAVDAFLEYLDASRHGLTEDEVLDILSRDEDVMHEARKRALHEFPTDALPVVIWIRLFDALQLYLMTEPVSGGQLLGFYHRQLRETVRQLRVEPRNVSRCELLVQYFEPALLHTRVSNISPAQARALSELPHLWIHTTHDGRHRLQQQLGDLTFVLAKISANLLDELLLDFDLDPSGNAEPLQRWRTFVLRHEHMLRRQSSWPSYKTLLQLAAESGELAVSEAAQTWLNGGGCDWLWLRNSAAGRIEEKYLERSLEVHSGPDLTFESLEGPWTISASKAGLWLWNLDSGARALLDTKPTRTAVVLPDGNVLSLRSSGEFSEWDPRTEQLLRTWPDFASYVEYLVMLSHQRALAWSAKGCELFDVESGRRIEFAGTRPNSKIWPLAPDAFMGFDTSGELVIWNAADGGERCRLRGAGEVIAAYRAANDLMLTGAHDGAISLWSLTTGQTVWQTRVHSKRVSELQRMADGRFFSFAWDGALAVFDLEHGRVEQRFEAHDSPVDGALQLPDGRIATWAFESYLLVWDPTSNKTLKLEAPYETLLNDVRLLPNGWIAAWGRLEGRMLVWDVQRAELVVSIAAHDVAPTGLLPVGESRFLTWAGDGVARLWQLAGSHETAVRPGHQRRVLGACDLAENLLATWGEDDPVLRIWSYQTGAQLREAQGHTRAIRTALLLPDGRIATGAEDAMVRVWSASADTCLTVFKGHKGTVTGLLLTPDGRLASYGYDASLWLWNIRTDAGHHGADRELSKHTGHVFDALCLPGDRLVSCGNDGLIVAWGLSTPDAVVMEHPKDSGVPIGLLSWSEQIVISRSNAGLVCVWDIHTGRLQRQWRETREFIGGLARLLDGRVAIWCGDDNVPSNEHRIWLWDPAGALPATILESNDATDRIWEHANGAELLTRSPTQPDGMFRAWDVRDGRCIEALRAEHVADQRPTWLRLASGSAASLHHDRHHGWDAGRVVGIVDDHSASVVRWQGDARMTARGLHADGTLAATSETGEVCILKLYEGATRVGVRC